MKDDINLLIEFSDDYLKDMIASDYKERKERCYDEIITVMRRLEKEYNRLDDRLEFPIKEKLSAGEYIQSFRQQGLISQSVALKLLILAKNPNMEYTFTK